MMSRMDRLPLRLPTTHEGRELLRFCVRLASSWDFPDGSTAEEIDWDLAAAQGAQMLSEEARP